MRGLDVHYGDAQALWAVDLDVGPGETVRIVGPNGAGKTTLVNTIAGLQPRSAGTILVDGIDVSRLPAHRVCDHGVATVPEGRRVFAHMTVRDNLLLGAYRPAARRGAPGDLSRGVRAVPAAGRAGGAARRAACPAASSRCSPSAGR